MKNKIVILEKNNTSKKRERNPGLSLLAVSAMITFGLAAGQLFTPLMIVQAADSNQFVEKTSVDNDIATTAQVAYTDEIMREGIVLGAKGSHSGLPLWIWLFAALCYLLIVNWSILPQRTNKMNRSKEIIQQK